MKIFLTGGTGFVGSAVLARLLRAGHSVQALARSDAAAAALATAGATPVPGDLTDAGLLARSAAAADGMIHLASPGDATSADVDVALLDAVLPALARSGKPYLHTSGVWIHGDGADLTEDSPFSPPPITAWRLPLDARVRATAGEGVRTVLIAPAIVYGHGRGLPNLLRTGPRSEQQPPALLYPGAHQHWTTVHVDDLADLYLRALTDAPAGSYYLGASGQNPLVRDLAQAASHAASLAGRVQPEPEQATRARLGPLAEAFLLDQQATGAKARSLGWAPVGPSLLNELATGSYAGQA